MNSAVRHHFPRFIIEPDQKWLFNPILKKRYKNLPEERVRLKWVEYLLHEAGWKKSRIAFESPVSIRSESKRGRTDLLLYDDDMNPKILIECKAESVPLNMAVAEQAARYNISIGAPVIILTNGLADYFFELSAAAPCSVDNPFELNTIPQDRHLAYWADRGFCSDKNNELLNKWLPEVLCSFWDDAAVNDVRYLAFKESTLPFPMEHYYRIFTMGENDKLAITFVGHEHSGSYCAAVLNRNGVNAGILIINLNKLAQKESDSAILISEGRTKPVPAEIYLVSFFDGDENHVKNLHNQLMKFFD